MNYLIYPTRVMNITQNHTAGNHRYNSGGSPADYPFDEACADSGRDTFYCPCDEVIVRRIYGVGAGGTNTVWLESAAPVDMPCGREVVTVMVMHPNDDDLSKLKTGQRFRRGEAMFREGTDGNASGNHFHISVGVGTIRGNGWTSNGGAWVLTTSGRNLKADEAFYAGGVTVRNAAGYTFKEENKMDNTPDSYAKAAVTWAQKEGILKGDESGDMMLHSPITRQDMLVFLHRAEARHA